MSDWRKLVPKPAPKKIDKITDHATSKVGMQIEADLLDRAEKAGRTACLLEELGGDKAVNPYEFDDIRFPAWNQGYDNWKGIGKHVL